MNVLIHRILPWLVTLLVPVALVLGAVRILLFPWFFNLDYRTPNFPQDPYGFTLQDRLRYTRIIWDYLLNNAGISFLGDLRFPQGQQAPQPSCQFMTDCTRLFNDRELMHMEDVKRVVQVALQVFYGVVLGLVVLGIWSWQGHWGFEYRRAMTLGGWLTLILIGVIILVVLIGFAGFFVFFHDLFFLPGTWTFFYSDTLIRLLPQRFFRDIFLTGGVITGILALLVTYIFKPR